jgi:glycosyltransferase involved in cell wall biosynthesis
MLRQKSRQLDNEFMILSRGIELFPGLELTSGMIDLLAEERAMATRGECPEPPNPEQPGELLRFIDWLMEIPEHSTSGLPRYMQAVYNERPDLQRDMPQVNAGELTGFAWWVHLLGRWEVPSLRLLGSEVPVKRRIPAGGRIAGGVDAIGFFNAEHGIGEAARLLVEALRTTDVPVSTIGYRNTESRQNYKFVTDEVGRYKTVIAAINAELNRPVRDLFGHHFFYDTYVIGQWFWELEVAPSWYRDAYQYVDELWAPTKFIEEMLRREAPSHIHVEYMPLPLRKPRVVEDATREDLDLDNRYMFLFTFDFMSVMKRKNPLGLVSAFKKAFSVNEGPMLVLKCINGESRPELFEELQRSCEGRPDIIVMNKYLDSHMSAALMNLCDCYVSLHRSEGLGLTIAEAMLLGKPVIATGYSGNLDFMTPETAFLVPWNRVKVGDGAEAYDANATWAEPDLDAAAAMMRHVYSQQDEAKAMAARGKADLEQRFTPESTGARMRNRLQELWETQNAKKN